MAKKKAPEYTVRQKRSGRFEVIGADGKNINGEKKAEILVKEGKIQAPKKKQEAPASEEPAAEEAPASE